MVFFVLFILALPLVHYRLIVNWKDKRICTHVGVILLVVNLILFIIWEFTSSDFPWFPWFIIPLAISVVVQIILFARWKTQKYKYKTPVWDNVVQQSEQEFSE